MHHRIQGLVLLLLVPMLGMGACQTLETPDLSSPTESSSSSEKPTEIGGTWKAEFTEKGIQFTSITQYKQDGTFHMRLVPAYGSPIEHFGKWKYSDGKLVEKSPTLPTAEGNIEWINNDTVEVTIIDNGYPKHRGRKLIAYRQ